ncbi:MAG: type II toxin-antitoxin system Phd/YefM family antitoxin [Treponemataceae bacterium]|nr:type II toxin-antitoxin system Phd/YefM family antitoxin [Treponemataceae bacterium]
MLVVTYSEARQNFASVLDASKKDGSVIVKRADGSAFRISPEAEAKSPFDGIKTLTNIKQEEILTALRETREEN